MPTCPKCSAPLPIREGKSTKFCTKCGYRFDAPPAEATVTHGAVPSVTQIPQPAEVKQVAVADRATPPIAAALQIHTSGTSAQPRPTPAVRQAATPPTIAATHAASATTSVPPISTDPLAGETSEFSSWKWNWGAFLVPGIWLLAHRIKPKIVPLLLLGVPIVILSVVTITNILSARSAEQVAASGVVQGFSDQPEYIWSNATMLAGWLLAFYVLACLLSIRVARTATLEAWRNFQQQRLSAFRSAQRLWAAGGLLICAVLITSNIVVWGGYNRTKQAAEAASAREFRVRQLTWVSQGAAGRRVVLRFYSTLMAGGDDCSIEIGGKSHGGALATFAGDTLTISRSMNGNSDPAIGKHTYKISADEQTLTEVGGDGQVLHPTQGK